MKKFEDLTFADHFIFEKVLQDKGICKELLERLLKIQIERIEFPELEKEISPYYDTRGVRLDVYVKDSDKVFDIEIQNYPETDLPPRTRYYQSMLDIDNLVKGQYYSDLPSIFILFICTYDPFGRSLPVYTFLNQCQEDRSLILRDGVTKKIYNAESYSKENDIAIKSFLEYIYNKKPVDGFTGRIESLVHKIKQQGINKKEYESMNIHDQDTFLRGKKEGTQETKIETARNLLEKDVSLQIIAECTGLPLEMVEELAKSIK